MEGIEIIRSQGQGLAVKGLRFRGATRLVVVNRQLQQVIECDGPHQ